MRSRLAAGLLLAGLTLSAAPGCSMILVNTIPVKPDEALRLGAPRSALSDVLGAPSRTDAAPRDRFALYVDPASEAVLRDVYRTTGLVRCPGDRYASDWNVYPAFLIGTLGLCELEELPRVIGDLAGFADECWEIYAWYDAADRLVAWGRRPVSSPCDDAR